MAQTTYNPVVPTYISLSETTLATASSSITLTGFDQSYRDLIIVYTGLATGQNVRFRLNGDTSTSYNVTYMLYYGTSKFPGKVVDGDYANLVTLFDNEPSNFVLNMFDFSSTDRHKNWLFKSADGNYSGMRGHGRWAKNDAIQSITFFMGSGNIPSGATFKVYGIEA